MNNKTEDAHFSPAIRRARLDELTIYEISEDELSTLENGGPESIYLNIAIALLSSSLACLLAAGSITIESEFMKIAYVSFIVLAILMALVLLILWRRSKKSVSNCVKKIRKRLPPEGESLGN